MKILIKLFTILIVVALFTGLDFVTKTLASNHLLGNPSQFYLGGFIELIYAENIGGMLGFGDQLPELVRFLIFEVMVTAVLLILIFYLLFKDNLGIIRNISYLLILSGGLGNLIDRVFNDGRVVDFIVLGIGNLHTGIFNFADVYVTSGVLLILVHSFFQKAPAPIEQQS
jgi:signal peptidase II